ncbi:hypothetical protein [Streptomyces sp. NPDC088736]|uniref:hypothetical protein n=1 Tax=Streptomyces sp. NPDC088736 TaxID=3365881 RepID=UPI0037FD7E2F
MPDPSTSRLGLYKSKSDGSELVNYPLDLGGNWDKVDNAAGFQIVTSTTRPATPYPGKPITESNTGYRSYFSNGSSPASGSWVEIPNSSGVFGGNLSLATGSSLSIGTATLTRSSGGSLSANTNYQRAGTATTDVAFSALVSADTFDRLRLYADGKLEIGPGSGARDVNLYRSAANVLTTDDSLNVGLNLTVGGIGQRLTAVKPSNETVTSSTTLQNDDHLTATLDANSVYRIYMLLNFGGVTAGEIKTSWTTPASATGFKSCMGPGSDSTTRDTGATTTMRYGIHNFTTTVNYGCNDTSLLVHAIEQGIVTTTTGGTFVLQWAQQASSATGSIMAAGSYLIAEKIG